MGENFDARVDRDPNPIQQNAPENLSRAVWQPPGVFAHSSIMDVAQQESTPSTLDNIVRDSRMARLGLVTVEGLAYTLPGAAKAAYHDFTHPGEALTKAGGALTLGVGLRTLLPRSGAGRAIAAGIFTFYLAKDALTPVIRGYGDAWNAQNHHQINVAAQVAGDGLGMFAWDSYWGMKFAGWGERGAERALSGMMGAERFGAFEAAKGQIFGSDRYFFGRAGQAVHERVNGRTVNPEPELTHTERMRRIREAETEHGAATNLRRIYMEGARTLDGRPLGFSETIDALLSGQNVRGGRIAEPGLREAPHERVTTTLEDGSTVTRDSTGNVVGHSSSTTSSVDFIIRTRAEGRSPLSTPEIASRTYEFNNGTRLTVDSQGRIVEGELPSNTRLTADGVLVTADTVLPTVRTAAAPGSGIADIPGFRVDLTTGRVLEADTLSRGLQQAKFRWHGDRGVTVEYFDNQGKLVSRVRNNEYDANNPAARHAWEVEYFRDNASIGRTRWEGGMTLRPAEGRFSWEPTGGGVAPRGPNWDYGRFATAADATRPGGGATGAPAEVGRPTEAGGAGTDPLQARVSAEVNAETLTLLARMNKQDMARWPEERQQVVDVVEGAVGPVDAALNPRHRTFDPGYGEFRDQMVQLGNQVRDANDLQQVAPLFLRAQAAATQVMTTNLGPTGRLTHELNLFSHEIHTGLRRGLQRAGVNADVVLAAKNPPLNQIAFDQGAGPHTLPEIDGVWDVDLVHYPRNMVGTRSITTSGIYGHEFGHNQYGGLLRFADSIRETVIRDAVTAGLQAHGARIGVPDLANQMIEVPGVGQMSKADVITEILKAQANENTADMWGAAWTGPNSATSLGVLLQSLRAGGKLETRNVFGAEFRAPDNPLGFEVHANDAFRPRLVAEVLRQRSNGDPLLNRYADALDTYARQASREGDYVWASLDQPGKSVTLGRAEIEACIPFLVREQLTRPLPAFDNKASFGDILPDLVLQMRQMDTLADLMVRSVLEGRTPDTIPFSTSEYSISQVFGAGMPGASRLIAQGMSAAEANSHMNRISDYLRGKFHDGDPHIDPLRRGPVLDTDPQINQPPALVDVLKTPTRENLRDTGGRIRNFMDRRAGFFAGYTGMAGSRDLYSLFSPVWRPGLYNFMPVDQGRTNQSGDNQGSTPPQLNGPEQRTRDDQNNRDRFAPPQRPPAPTDQGPGSPRTIPAPHDPFMLDRQPRRAYDPSELMRMNQQGRALIEQATKPAGQR